MASVATPAMPVANRGMIMGAVMLSTVMTALDTTIANVALPHMAGSVSASADQITWVLTSYIIAGAIVTPMTGWLTGRFGPKNVFLFSIIGFTVASALCGAAQSLSEIVVFRLLQGMFGAPLMPLSQAVVLDTFTLEERGPALAVWSTAVMVAPIAGPVLGGWLTDDLNWRWVFYINLPLGLISVAGIMAFFPEARSVERRRFDLTGFALLSIMLAAIQLFLDRGANNDWFRSSETIIEASVAAVAFILFMIHSGLADQPFVPIEMFGDRNFAVSSVLSVLVGTLAFAVLALLPPMIETVLGYPVITTGFVTAPRGVGSLVSMFIAGQVVGKVDTRLMILFGLGLFSTAFHQMSHFNLGMDSYMIATTGFIQGLGSGFVFIPLSSLAFASLPQALRTDGAGVYTLVRNLGNSAGIAVMQAIYTTNVQVVHSRLISPLTKDNPLARAPFLSAPYSLTDSAGMAVLNSEVNRQAAMVSYVDVFHMMFIATLLATPLVLLLRPTQQGGHSDEIIIDH